MHENTRDFDVLWEVVSEGIAKLKEFCKKKR